MILVTTPDQDSELGLWLSPYLMFMRRIVEPELMDDREQAEAYARADFEESNRAIVESFDVHFPGVRLSGDILDLGLWPGRYHVSICGPVSEQFRSGRGRFLRHDRTR